jgi:plasmid replication initiation protein
MAKLIQVDGDLEVKKADVVVKARYKLNPLPLKFITTLISGLKRSDDINEEYVFKVRDFKELTGLKRKDLYWAVKEALKELLEKPLHIPTKDGFIMCNWISGGHYVENAGEVRFMIYPKLRPFLLEAQKKFLKYKLENILSLRSSYSIRLYEILKDWLELNARYGNKAEKIVSLKELREILEVPKSYQYGNSSGIKKRILEKAKSEFEEHTDIIFEYEEIKTGRKVTHLKFIIRPNPAKLEDNYTKKLANIFKNRGAFVSYLRKNYAGTGKAFGYRTINGKKWWLKLDKNRLLYGSIGAVTIDNLDNDLTKEFNSLESGELYDLWFKIAQNSNIYKDIITQNFCLYEIFKENKELYMELQQEILLLQKQGII